LIRRIQPKPNFRGRSQQRVQTLDTVPTFSVRNFAGGETTRLVTLSYDVNRGTKNDEVSWSSDNVVQPRDDVLAVDVVLNNGDEPLGAVLVGDLRREPKAKIEQSSSFWLAIVIVMHPSLDGPSIKLAASNMHGSIKLSRQPVSDHRLSQPFSITNDLVDSMRTPMKKPTRLRDKSSATFYR